MTGRPQAKAVGSKGPQEEVTPEGRQAGLKIPGSTAKAHVHLLVAPAPSLLSVNNKPPHVVRAPSSSGTGPPPPETPVWKEAKGSGYRWVRRLRANSGLLQ